MINTDYFQRWSELDQKIEGKETGEYTIMFVTTECFNNVYISNNKDNERSFYVEFSKDFINSYRPKKINGLTIAVEDNSRINKDKMYLSVRNKDKENDEAFIAFSVMVFNEIENTKNDEQTLQLIEGIIDQYHDFFGFKKRVSKQEEQGLLAELLFLEQMIKKFGESFVRCWCGSEKNKRDFIMNDVALEIKSTLNQKQDIIHVSNENQLDPENLKKLYLRLYVFDENPDGENVIEVFERINNMIESFEFARMLVVKLFMRGIDPKDYEAQYRFKTEAIKTYEIDSSFPKITKANTPAEAFEIKYKLNLTSIQTYDGDILW